MSRFMPEKSLRAIVFIKGSSVYTIRSLFPFSHHLPAYSVGICIVLIPIHRISVSLVRERLLVHTELRIHSLSDMSDHADRVRRCMSISDFYYNSTDTEQDTVTVRRSVSHAVHFRCEIFSQSFAGRTAFVQHGAEVCTLLYLPYHSI